MNYPDLGNEFIGAGLLAPLIPGEPVSLSFSIAVAGFGWHELSPGISANGISIWFSTQAGYAELPGWAALTYWDVPTDTSSWIHVSGLFVPDSAYTRVLVGVPFTAGLLQSVVLNSTSLNENAYLYIDDVCVSYGTDYCGSTALVVGERAARGTISLHPDPCTDLLYVTGLDPASSTVNVRISDATGRCIYQGREYPRSGSFMLQASGWPTGPLILRLSSDEFGSRGFRFLHF